MKRLSGAMIALIAFTIVVVVFQNCAGYEPMTNPLYDRTEASTCIGPSCAVDLNSVQIKVMTGYGSQITLKKVPAMSTTCDITSCFEVAGYCDTGGYTYSRLYYSFTIGTTARTLATSASCDSNGRFSFLVNLTEFASGFNYDNIYPFRVGMQVLDEENSQWVENPSGLNVQNLSITGRTDPTPTPVPTAAP